MFAPKGEHFVVFDHSLTQNAQGMVAIALVNGNDGMALGLFVTHAIAMPAEQCDKMMPKCGLINALLQASCCGRLVLKHPDVFPVLQAACEFNFPKLNGLETACRAEAISKLNEIGGHHRLEDAELWNEKPNN